MKEKADVTCCVLVYIKHSTITLQCVDKMLLKYIFLASATGWFVHRLNSTCPARTSHGCRCLDTGGYFKQNKCV